MNRFFFNCIFPHWAILHFSSSKSSTASTTTQQSTDNRVAAAEGGFALASGASVSIQNLDAAVARAALEEGSDSAARAIEGMRETAGRAFDANTETAGRSLAANVETSGRAFNTVENVAARAIDSNTSTALSAINLGDDVSARSLETLRALGENQMNFAAKTVQDLSSSLTRNAGEAASTVISDTAKSAIWALGLAAAIVGIYVVSRSKKAA